MLPYAALPVRTMPVYMACCSCSASWVPCAGTWGCGHCSTQAAAWQQQQQQLGRSTHCACRSWDSQACPGSAHARRESRCGMARHMLTGEERAKPSAVERRVPAVPWACHASSVCCTKWPALHASTLQPTAITHTVMQSYTMPELMASRRAGAAMACTLQHVQHARDGVVGRL